MSVTWQMYREALIWVPQCLAPLVCQHSCWMDSTWGEGRRKQRGTRPGEGSCEQILLGAPLLFKWPLVSSDFYSKCKMLVSAFCPTPNPPLAKFKLAMECCLQIANILEYPLLDSYPSWQFCFHYPGNSRLVKLVFLLKSDRQRQTAANRTLQMLKVLFRTAYVNQGHSASTWQRPVMFFSCSRGYYFGSNDYLDESS